MEALEDRITNASESTNARFKRKKIRSTKREADKIAEKLRESAQALKLLEPRVPKDPTLKQHPQNRNKHIEAPGMDPDTFLNRIRRFLIDLLKKESKTGAVRSQTTTWIRFRKDRELVELAFNSTMTNVYKLSDMDEMVNEMIAHMKGQIENPALANSRFVFDEVLFTNIDFHQLNLTRGSSYLPLPNWLARKKAIINPKNEDQECFKWAVIAASR